MARQEETAARATRMACSPSLGRRLWQRRPLLAAGPPSLVALLLGSACSPTAAQARPQRRSARHATAECKTA